MNDRPRLSRPELLVARVDYLINAVQAVTEVTFWDPHPPAARLVVTALDDGRLLGSTDVGVRALMEAGFGVQTWAHRLIREQEATALKRPTLRLVQGHASDTPQ
jgi:hypothetical protein